MEPVTLRTARLELSVPTLDDADAITAAAQDPELRKTARKAVDGLRRGIIAYSSVG